MSAFGKINETLDAWLDRLELGMAGGEPLLRRAREALKRGEPLKARILAHEILSRSPSSPIGLALLADACEQAGLSDELIPALEELGRRAPPSGDLWLRIGAVRKDPADAREAFRRAFRFGTTEQRDAAVLALADLDLAEHEPTRADVWLDQLLDDRSPRAALRRIESALLRRDPQQAKRYLGYLADDPSDARLALAKGEAMDLLGDPHAVPQLLRALLLDAPRALEALAWSLRGSVPAEIIERVERVAHDRGDEPILRAALARARGDQTAALKALRETAKSGDGRARDLFLRTAVDLRDKEAIREALALPGSPPAQGVLLPLLAQGADLERFDALSAVDATELLAWSADELRAVLREWAPRQALTTWPPIVARLDRAAVALRAHDEARELVEFVGSLALPLRVAVVGEFNAGKSTFLNALAGEALSPMGILPTTATVFLFRFGSDRVARLRRPDRTERFVPLERLKGVLSEETELEDVTLFLPLSSLRSVELMDTPGFNAPMPGHRERAKLALEQADALIWLLDGAQPLKHSEREQLETLRGIPIQFVINKADRLTTEELATVCTETNRGLDEIGLRSVAPLIAVSAKAALSARLANDTSALTASGWPVVEDFVRSVLLGQRNALRDRSQRRGILKIVRNLRLRAEHVFESERLVREETAVVKRRLHERRATLQSEFQAHAEALAEALRAPAHACQRELDAVPREKSETNERYRIERVERHLLPPILALLSDLVGGELPQAFEFAARGALMQLAWDLSDEIERLAATAVRLLIDALAAPQQDTIASKAESLARELALIEAALKFELPNVPDSPMIQG